MNQLLAFYHGTGTDHRGRTLAEILRQDDLWFEITHDFIQWLFPLNELSRASLHAPLVDGATLHAFQADPLLRDALALVTGPGSTGAAPRMVRYQHAQQPSSHTRAQEHNAAGPVRRSRQAGRGVRGTVRDRSRLWRQRRIACLLAPGHL